MNRPIIWAAALMVCLGGHAAKSEDLAHNSAAPARVRYIVNDVHASSEFYTGKLGFKVDFASEPYFTALSRGGLQLLLSPVNGPGGASRPMPNGDKPTPGGWTRMVLNVPDIAGEVDRLRKLGVHFRNDIVVGLGGKEVLLDDPSGNPVELFQPD